ncbi:SAM-dependent methyltransferase [Spinactinospora alkalitolerans]|uniref:SAM-dependent methyltransferase n=1 Tax=Spinactinospora alkalitolerans TaxID=687207 RepID=A0A852TYV2_9ACTN|nr:SAM-dependent methyltransferase [Spinactinospora alkalitolerans]NYE46990.1 SAM-dependent methyltransferase [Spinactinospora alkalitolerans]
MGAMTPDWMRRTGAARPGWQPPAVDLQKPSPARMYDYYLGGKDNFQVDRDAVREILADVPELFQTAQENRSFLRRAVRLLAESGIRQFVDVGAGLPTQGNVHEIAQGVRPDARVVYVDNDPIVLAHARALLADNGGTSVVRADARDPDAVIGQVRDEGLIDLSRPVAVLFVAVLHFVSDEEDPASIVRRFRSVMAPGSHLVIAHGTRSAGDRAVDTMTQTYNRATAPVHLRDPEEIRGFFDGFDLLPPGACHLPWWRPDPAGVPADATRWHYGGVARLAD